MSREFVVGLTLLSWLLASPAGTARAEVGAPTSSANAVGSSANAVGAPPAPPPDHGSDNRALTGITMLGAGVVALAAGLYGAAHFDRQVGPCDAQLLVCPQNDNWVPLSIAVAGAGGILAVLGAFEWLYVPSTTVRVGMSTSALTLSGHF